VRARRAGFFLAPTAQRFIVLVALGKEIETVRYPNLRYAASLKRLRNYELARAVGMSEWRLSRVLTGRAEFTPAEREKICSLLGFSADWLFANPVPPSAARLGGSKAEPVVQAAPMLAAGARE